MKKGEHEKQDVFYVDYGTASRDYVQGILNAISKACG